MQDCLGGTPDAGLGGTVVLGPQDATGCSGLASLVPIINGREDAVRERLRDLPSGSRSPFRRVPGTHFARLTVLHREKAGANLPQRIELVSSWLLFVVDFDGPFGPDTTRARRIASDEVLRYAGYLDAIPELKDLWSDCYGFDPHRRLEHLLAPSVVKRFVYFCDYPDATLRQIQLALEVRRQFVGRLAGGLLTSRRDVEDFLDWMAERHEIHDVPRELTTSVPRAIAESPN